MFVLIHITVPSPWNFNTPKFSNSYLSSQYDDLQMNMKIALQFLPRKSQHFPLKIFKKNLQTVEVLGFELFVCFSSINPIKSHIKCVVYVKTILYTTFLFTTYKPKQHHKINQFPFEKIRILTFMENNNILLEPIYII